MTTPLRLIEAWRGSCRRERERMWCEKGSRPLGFDSDNAHAMAVVSRVRARIAFKFKYGQAIITRTSLALAIATRHGSSSVQ
jgi:hypothetical protein